MEFQKTTTQKGKSQTISAFKRKKNKWKRGRTGAIRADVN